MTQVLMLAVKSSRISIHLSVAAWVILFLGSQIGYASVGLCYSVEKTEDRALLVPGNVSIPNLSTIETNGVIKSSNSLRAQQYAANSYGTVSLAFNGAGLDDMPEPGTLWFADDDSIFCSEKHCSYVFHETNTQTLRDPQAIPVTVTTNRSVNATAQCSSYRVVQGGNGTDPSIRIKDGSREVNITVPNQNGPDQTTYMTTTSESCGDDCSIVSVFEASSTDPWFYNCTARLGPVVNASRPEHKLGANLTRLATSAIALQGYANSGSFQFMTYPSAASFGVPANGSAELMGLLLSRFTIGVLSTVVDSNSNIVIKGQAPTIGQKLGVSHWGIIHLIFWLTAGLQLLLAVLATWVAERVVVPEGNPLAEAQVLQSMVTQKRPQMINDETFETVPLGEARSLWTFKDRYVGDGVYDLYMEEAAST
ncbi:hypothetical protein ACHAPT_011023 [Fusarium lateritium]